MTRHNYSKDEIEFGPDVDLDTDEVYDRKGARVDRNYVEQAIADVQHYRAGRPGLGTSTGPSPRVSFRLEPGVRDLAEKRAQKEGKTLSSLAREALEKYLGAA